MKRIAVTLLLFACCRLAPAQTKPDNQITPTVRIYQPKNPDVSRVMSLTNFVSNVIGPSVKVYWDEGPRAVVIRGNSPADLDAAEALLKRFDAPPQQKPAATSQAEVTAYLILAVSGGPPDHRWGIEKDPPQPKPIPAELQGAVEEMKHTFSYDHYSLADAIVLEPRGPGEQEGILPWGLYVQPYTTYSLAYSNTNVRNDNAVDLYDFQFSVKVPIGDKGVESKIKTNVVIRENQKLVLGKIRLDPLYNADLFLVLTAKVK